MEFFFVSSGRNKQEMAAIKELKPPRLMCSYHYFKNIDIFEFFKELGYIPKVMLDSGAYSAWNSGKQIDLDKYIEYIKRNEKYIWRYICLDKVGDTNASYEAWKEMKNRGLNPIPVFHYNGDEAILEKYIAAGEPLVALGGTVPIKNKYAVAEWARMLCWTYPETRFHLLGSASRKILDHCDLDSADAATWIIGAFMGQPKHIPGNKSEDKIERAKWNMKSTMEYYG